MIRLIGLDLDGTLLTGDKRLTDTNVRALTEAAERGVHIVPVTGRPFRGIPKSVTDLPFIRYCITSNGAVTTDRGGNRALRERYMTAETVKKVLEAAGEDVIREYFAGGYGFHDAHTHKMLWKRFGNTPIIDYLRQSRVEVEDLMASLAGQRTGIENISVMCATPEERMRVLDRVERIDGVRIIFPWPTDLEITSREADKGEALLSLAGSLGLEREEVMAVGDSNNDLGLMKAAGFSVAMGNSTKEILDAADRVTEDNEHDGVAAAIDRFVL